jgi:hypothetical protein
VIGSAIIDLIDRTPPEERTTTVSAYIASLSAPSELRAG